MWESVGGGGGGDKAQCPYIVMEKRVVIPHVLKAMPKSCP